MTTKQIRPSTLIEDFDLYPRISVDSTVIGKYADAYRAGADFPLPVVCADTLKIIDGFHRVRAWKRAFKDKSIKVTLETFANDKERMTRAIELNAQHGRPLTSQDRVRIVQQALKHGIQLTETAVLLKTSAKSLQTLIITRTASSAPVVITGKPSKPAGSDVILKPAFKHFAGMNLSAKQRSVNDYFAGNNLPYLVKQLRLAIEADMLPDRTADDGLWEELALLAARLNKLPLPELIT